MKKFVTVAAQHTLGNAVDKSDRRGRQWSGIVHSENETRQTETEAVPLLQVRFTKKATPELIDLVKERLKEGGIVVVSSVIMLQSTVLRVSASDEVLGKQAEHIHLMKPTTDGSRVVDYFTMAEKRRFVPKPSLNRSEEQELFTPTERILLIRRLLGSVSVLNPGEMVSPLSKLFDAEYRADITVHYAEPINTRGLGLLAGYMPESIRDWSESFRKVLREHGSQSACLLHVLRTYSLVDAVVPITIPKRQTKILENTLKPWWKLTPPVDEIQSYFGWEIGFYFAWMGFLTRWLIVPGVLGLVVYILRWYRGDTIDTDELTPFYGLVTFLWAVLSLRFWEREEHRLAYKWGTFSMSDYERQKFFAIRPEFRGYLRRSPVTGEMETYYPRIRRISKYLWSAFVTSFMLAVAFIVMILSLNLQGYIHPKQNPARWNKDNLHPFYFESFAELSENGQRFDENTSMAYIPIVGHVGCILVLNLVYRKVAERLTHFENHETFVDYRNSLVLKRFLFEAFDCYVGLFYLAFYERDVERLRMELIAVFQIDTIRRVFMECIVPVIYRRFNFAYQQKRKMNPNMSQLAVPPEDFLIDEIGRDDYEQFDDYMEMVIQLGYVTLFASAYPLASIISVIANWVEIRSDIYKLTQVCRRPDVFRSSGCGMWRTLMSCVIWTSALTNCLIAGFTSEQLVHYMPSFYLEASNGYINMGNEKGWIVVFLIFGLERILVVTGILIYAFVPAVPEDVMEELERRHFIRDTAHITQKTD